MDAQNLLQMIGLLKEKTMSGSIKWSPQKTIAMSAFTCRVAGQGVSISRGSQLSGLGSTRIIIVDQAGNEVVNVAEGEFLGSSGSKSANVLKRPTRIGSELGQLFEVARNSANKSDGVIQKIIGELNKL